MLGLPIRDVRDAREPSRARRSAAAGPLDRRGRPLLGGAHVRHRRAVARRARRARPRVHALRPSPEPRRAAPRALPGRRGGARGGRDRGVDGREPDLHPADASAASGSPATTSGRSSRASSSTSASRTSTWTSATSSRASTRGYFWLQSCGALLEVEQYGEAAVRSMCHAIEDPDVRRQRRRHQSPRALPPDPSSAARPGRPRAALPLGGVRRSRRRADRGGGDHPPRAGVSRSPASSSRAPPGDASGGRDDYAVPSIPTSGSSTCRAPRWCACAASSSCRITC